VVLASGVPVRLSPLPTARPNDFGTRETCESLSHTVPSNRMRKRLGVHSTV
jgi:hypothetical protein